MPFKSFLVKKYEFSHENEFFRSFSASLENAFGKDHSFATLIGNVSINGHQLDAIFIAYGQITVIDFKDYEGTLTFSENDVWRLQTNAGKLIFVKGGSQIRNPFQQVRAYKFSLLELLSTKQEDILDANHSSINWGHISAMVLFQNKVATTNPEDMPDIAKRWFSIQDKDSIINALNDKHSSGLELSNGEIQRILDTIGIAEDMLLSSHNFKDETPHRADQASNPQRFHAIQKMLDEGVPASKTVAAIRYYKTLIKAEQYKQATATDLSTISIEDCGGLDAIKIPFTRMTNFYASYNATNASNFPKDVFVGLHIILDGQSFSLLHTIIPNKDLRNTDHIEVDSKILELHEPTLEKLELGEELIEEIKNELSIKKELSGKIEALQEILGMPIVIGHHFVLGLSQEELYTAQLKSELNKLEKRGLNENTLFEAFITNSPFLENIPELDVRPMVEITPLNASQRRAVKQTFAQPISVITGPPGTGKTQVILNLVANAIVHNHNTLFVSRNNKAVDNVLDKMELLLNEKYLVKFGARNLLEEETKPFLRERINNIAQIENGAKARFEENLDAFEKESNDVALYKKRIAGFSELVANRDKANNVFLNAKTKTTKWLGEQNKALLDLSSNLEKPLSYNQNLGAQLYQKIVAIEGSWLKKVFAKKKTIISIEEFYNSLNPSLKVYADNHFPYVEIEKDPLHSGKSFINGLVSLKKDIDSLIRKRKALKEEETKVKALLSGLENSINEIENNRGNYRATITEYEATIVDKSKAIVDKAIASHLSQLSTSAGYDYIDSLPNKAWRDNEVKRFNSDASTFLEHYKVIAITNLTVKNSVPLENEIIDLLIIDEASQCDIASIIPLLYRAKRIAVIGDPMQLRHITSIKKYESEFVIDHLNIRDLHLDYVGKSLYDYCFELATKSNLQSTFLDEHYRCHPEIIEFSNHYIYSSSLGQRMLIKSDLAKTSSTTNSGLQWINVKGTMDSRKNENDREVEAIYQLVERIKRENPGKSLGITTPFKHQKERLRSRLLPLLSNNDEIIIDTVHRFQGDEKDIMIFSLVVAENSPESKIRFLNQQKHLLNVGITRAISSLYIVGDHQYCTDVERKFGKNVLSDLAKYSSRLNKVID